MAFIKGDRNVPKCGFTRQLIEILNDTKQVPYKIFLFVALEYTNRLWCMENRLSYETFDILTDEEVRQGLKSFSNWPTYPQVYVKGNLVGGLDIIKELREGGELLSTLKGEQNFSLPLLMAFFDGLFRSLFFNINFFWRTFFVLLIVFN